MPSFSSRSKERLSTVHEDLQKVFNEVVKTFDCTVVYGHRTPKEQFELFKKGREFEHGQWTVTDKSKVVTYKDGYDQKSKHNSLPSLAVDVVPFPIEWENTDRMRFFAGYVLGVANYMYSKGEISNKIVSGFDWDSDTYLYDHRFQDGPHFQIA